MRFQIFNDYDQMSEAAAQIIIEQINKKPETVFCMPGGSSVMGMYDHLVEHYKNGEVDFSKIRALDMDAYVGLGQFHENNYSYFNDKMFLSHVNVPNENRYYPDSMTMDPVGEAEKYAKLIKSFGGLDISATGVGDDGHICFDEPEDYLMPFYHVADLHEETRVANSRFFTSIDEVPRQSFTLGLQEVMCCRTFLVLASGERKASIFKKMFESERICTQYPVSFLRMHPNCIFLLDKAAASMIPEKELEKYLDN